MGRQSLPAGNNGPTADQQNGTESLELDVILKDFSKSIQLQDEFVSYRK